MLPGKNLRIVWLTSAAILVAGLLESSALQLGSRPAADRIERLENSKRIASLKIEEVLARLKLKPGDIVADIGAGTGVFTRPLARAVGPTGKVFSVEVDQALLDDIDKRSRQEQLENIQTVLGEFNDPKLPSRQMDLAFFHDVLHHIEHRETYLKALASYLKPAGRIVVIDLVMDKNNPGSPHANEPEMYVTKEDVARWMDKAGFYPVEEFDLFTEKYFVIYARKQ